MRSRAIAVVTAGLGAPSSSRMLADRLTESTVERLRADAIDTRITVIELRDLAHDITNAMLTGFPNSELATAIDAVTGADGVIAVTPIFTASYSGLFKSFFDVLDRDALDGMPVLVGATGGTERHSLALDHGLRPLFGYLRAVVPPTTVFAASSDWGGASATAALGARIHRAGAEFADLVARSERSLSVRDPFALDGDFASRIGGGVA
ncbi:FMN reductase [Planctomonas psychrotolerans]|uniref:FMN reductase n=1 Tax=Planctomonas psychrotolerans TaxID=2528712 RepID=UPI001D0D7C19|nr:FMN reductase [Planctomonas psychrotolerans]